MKFLVKLLIASLLLFLQIGFSCIAQSEAVPFGLSFLVTLFYGFWCGNYILGFINGILSWSAFFMAVGIWYAMQGISFWNVVGPAFTAPPFYGLALLFGIIGILSVKLGRWFRKKEKPVE